MRLYIPANLWVAAVETLHGRPHDRERALFLDGPRPTSVGPVVATTLVLPPVDHSRGHYAISAKDMSRVGRHLRSFDFLRLAQMHSHPAGSTDHSDHDDEMAYSRRDGALSIVVPHYGACAPGLADCGVHHRDADGWRRLAHDEVDEYIVVVPSVLDFRAS